MGQLKRRADVPKVVRDSALDASRAEYESLRSATMIDKNDLDTMLVQHPGVVHTIGEAEALAISWRDQKKSDMEQAGAQADTAVRVSATSDGGKLTEGQVRALIAQEPSVIEATSAYNDWKLLAALWGTLGRSFEARGKALASLERLWIAGYWGDVNGRALTRNAGDRVAQRVRGDGQ